VSTLDGINRGDRQTTFGMMHLKYLIESSKLLMRA